MVSSKLYQKYCNGDKLSDKEVLQGMKLFDDAASALILLGSCFSISFKAANSTYVSFWNMAKARGILPSNLNNGNYVCGYDTEDAYKACCIDNGLVEE